MSCAFATDVTDDGCLSDDACESCVCATVLVCGAFDCLSSHLVEIGDALLMSGASAETWFA